LNAILYVLSTGCQWRALPKDFPPKSTVHDYFVEWHCDGTLTRIHHALYAEVRKLAGKSRWQQPQSSKAKASRARKRGA
jgi:transposase